MEDYRTHSSIYNTSYTVGIKLYHTCTYNRLPEDVPSGSKPVQDTVKIKKKISLTKVHFVGLYYTIILQCNVQNT